MDHDVTVEGSAFRLRPVRLDDAGFVIALRSDPELGRFLHPITGRLQDQTAWLESYFERPNDWYFVVERLSTGEPEGTIAVYDLDPAAHSAEWGRWIIRRGSFAAVESALLLYRAAFQRLGVQNIFCRTVAENRGVVSFHDSCGLTRAALLHAHFRIGDCAWDAVEHRLSAVDWPGVEERLSIRAEQLGSRLNRRHVAAV